MSYVISIKRGDTWKVIQARARPQAGQELPLVGGATGVLIIRNHGTTDAPVVMTGLVTIESDGSDVLCTYDWAAGDTDTVSDWDAEFELTLSDGTIWTIPGTDKTGTPVYLRVLIVADLGSAV